MPTPTRTHRRPVTLVVRLLLAVCLAALAATVSAGPAAADPPLFGNSGDFIGTWRNADPGTSNVTRVAITPAGGILPVYIRTYARCGAGECDWGRADGHWGGAGTTVMTAKYLAKSGGWFVFATRKMTLKLTAGGRIDYQVVTDFADPGRQDYVVSGRLVRV